MDPLQALIRLKHRQKGEHFMNYGKNGVRARQKALTSKSAKWGRKAALTLIKGILNSNRWTVHYRRSHRNRHLQGSDRYRTQRGNIRTGAKGAGIPGL